MRWIGAAWMAFFLVPAAPAGAAIHWRPTNPPGSVTTLMAPTAAQPYNDYATPETLYAGGRVVVHYVTRGIDAPPLNDDDGDAVPDYVERVAAAGDASVTYFERRGFATITADAGGPDERPDIYVSRFAPGTFGIAYPSVNTWEGGFVVVANSLDPSPEASLGSINGIVAHELFHLVQFSYFGPEDDPAIQLWALEGSAAAIENGAFPDLDDIVNRLQLRPWLDGPETSLTKQTYGSQALWRYLDERFPRFLPTYLGALAAVGNGDEQHRIFVTTFTHVAHMSFRRAFLDFAVFAQGEYGSAIAPLATLHRRLRGAVPPFAIHYVRLERGARRILVTAVGAGTAVTYEWGSHILGSPSAFRRLRPTPVDRNTWCFTLPRNTRSERFQLPRLIVANGSATRALQYVVRGMPVTDPC